MEFDDFFKKNERHHTNDHHRPYSDHRSSHSYHQHNNIQKELLYKIQNNPKLKKLAIIVILVFIIIIILLITFLFPFIAKIFNYLLENGLQGVVDGLWKGVK